MQTRADKIVAAADAYKAAKEAHARATKARDEFTVAFQAESARLDAQIAAAYQATLNAEAALKDAAK